MDTTNRLRIGVIGCGLIARRTHLPAFAACPEAEIAALASGHIESAQVAAARFGDPQVFGSWEELVGSPVIDAIDICTPNALHAPIAIAAARAGKHVLVEKPMATTLAEADAMIKAAHETGVTLMVAHNLRFAPVYETAKQLLLEGIIGQPLAASGTMMHAGPDESWGARSDWFWRQEMAGGGSLLDLGIHVIDLLLWLIGRPVLKVTAMTARLQKPTFAEDNAMLVMCFEGDVLASVQSSWTARPFPERRLVIHGELGHLTLDAAAPEPLAIYRTGKETFVPPVPETSVHGNLFLQFVECARRGTPPVPSGEEGRAGLAVALAAYESARSGRAVAIEP